MFYHGTSSSCKITHKLLPPSITNNLSEKGRKKNLDKIFFTDSIKYAQIYAGRTCARFGGTPVIMRVIPFGTKQFKKQDGCNIFMADYAFVEKIKQKA